MLRDYRTIGRVAYIVIFLALVLIALTIVIVSSSSPMSRSTTIQSGSPYEITYNQSVNAGDYLFYTITTNSTSGSLSAYLIGPGDVHLAYLNHTGSGTMKGSAVASSQGNWSLYIAENANTSQRVSLTVYRVSYASTYTLVFSLSLLPSGLVLLLFSSHLKKVEASLSRRQRRLE